MRETRQNTRTQLFLWLLAMMVISLVAVGCGDDEESPSGEPGDECAEVTDCEEGLVCDDNGEGTNTCQRAAGAECDPEADDNDFCIAGSECVELPPPPEGDEPDPEAPAAQCLIAEGGECNPDEGAYCDLGLTCAELQSGSYACYPPVVFRGMVFDSANRDPIEGAHVVALNDTSVAVTDIGVSDAEGNYSIEVPTVRDENGAPVGENFTLRSSADGYQAFPSGIRTALPINTGDATEQDLPDTEDEDDREWVIQGTITDIALIPLEDPNAARTTISGTVLADELSAGVLVAAETGDTAITAVASVSGDYTIFNVPPGSYTVKGYKAGVQLEPQDVSVGMEPLIDVDLPVSDRDLVTVSGSVNIVNPGDGEATSVVLVVESTFNETFGRGEVPPGLRAPESGAPDVTGNWSIEGVPEGRYVVLAAFENDRLVRDPDTNIAGTDFVTIEIPGDEDLAEAFKITGALAVNSPGAERPEPIMGQALDLVWEDDSSEDYYQVQVYNAYGDLVWEDQMVDSVSGSDEVRVEYGGPLETGMYYQFRASSWRAPGGNPAPISTTEDLLGVFFVPAAE